MSRTKSRPVGWITIMSQNQMSDSVTLCLHPAPESVQSESWCRCIGEGSFKSPTTVWDAVWQPSSWRDRLRVIVRGEFNTSGYSLFSCGVIGRLSVCVCVCVCVWMLRGCGGHRRWRCTFICRVVCWHIHAPVGCCSSSQMSSPLLRDRLLM